jgi:hypothetical protein
MPDWCQYKDDCKQQKIDNDGCDAKRFIHSAWCARPCAMAWAWTIRSICGHASRIIP